MKSTHLIAAGLVLFATAARAQWRTVDYTLRGGWNAIYLHGEATHIKPLDLFKDHPEVLEVWRWNPNPNPLQIGGPVPLPNISTPEWTYWLRAGNVNEAFQFFGQSAYLVRCASSVVTSVVPITQRILPPRTNWLRTGANFLGFPTGRGTRFPSFAEYFETFPAAISGDARVYQYVGGELGPANPFRVMNTALENVSREQAYWFESPVVADFFGPIEVRSAVSDGLAFGAEGGVITVKVRNRTSATVTLTIAPENSAPAPKGQPGVYAPVPLLLRTFDTAASGFREDALAGAVQRLIPPNSTIDLSFAVGPLTGPVGSNYASFVKFTDSGNLIEIWMPATATRASRAGLWVGDVKVTDVENKARTLYAATVTNGSGSVTSASAFLSPTSIAPRIVRHPSSVAVLAEQSASFSVLATGTGPLRFQWRKNGENLTGATSAVYSILKAGKEHEGAYSCVVTNDAGANQAATSAVANLTVASNLFLDPLEFRSVVNGGTATFTAPASQPAATAYLWKKDGKVLAGQTNPTLVLPGANSVSAGTYTCEATTPLGTIVSSPAILEVTSQVVAPTILAQPISQEIAIGSSVKLRVLAAGTSTGSTTLSYQWLRNDVVIHDKTAASLVVEGKDIATPTNFRCEVANSAGRVMSSVAVLTPTKPVLNAVPQSVVMGNGQGASFSVSYFDAGAVSVQWLKNGSPIPGATAQTLILSPAEVAAAAASGTARSYPLRVLIHVDAAGTARLLSQVFIGQLAAGASGLCVRESDLKADARHLATRLLAAHMPLDVDLMAQVDPARGSGTVELGQTLERLVPLPFDANTNPFVHTYHPDHDNKTARMSPYGVAGAESYDVSRVCRFTFPAARPTSNANSAWGTSYLSGTYSETITGLHKDPLTVTGTFELRRVNTISAITLPSAAGQ